MNKEITVAFDVDGTLIYQTGDYVDTPRYDVIDMFHMYEKLGCNMIIWSGSGMEYAKRWAEKLGLDAVIFDKAGAMVDIAVDDQEVTLGKINIQV